MAMRNLGILLALIVTVATTGVAQEYDDMYFNSTDRKKAKKKAKQEQEALEFNAVEDYTSGLSTVDDYSINEASVETYQEEAEQSLLQYQSPYNSTNPVTQASNPDFGGEELSFQYTSTIDTSLQEAYDQGYEDGLAAGSTIVNNNYYGQNGFGNAFYDPWFYDPWWGWNGGWNVTFGWGWGWNNWGWNNWRYDPWLYGGWGWNRPFFRPVGWGWNTWGWNNWGWNNFYCPTPFYDNGGYYIAANTPSKQAGRQIQNGPRVSRGGTNIDNGGTPARGASSVASASARTDGRDFSSAQSKYSRGSRTLGDANSNLGRSESAALGRQETTRRGYVRRGTTNTNTAQVRGNAPNQRGSGSTEATAGRNGGQTTRATRGTNTNTNRGTVTRGGSTNTNRNYSSRSNSSSSGNRNGNVRTNRNSNSNNKRSNVNRNSSSSRSSGSRPSVRSSSSRSSSARSSSPRSSSRSSGSRSSGSKSSSSRSRGKN